MRAPRTAGRRFDGVEGLRGLAAGAVLLDHVYLYGAPDGERYDLGALGFVPRTSGTLGVCLFFTLSGFLLYRPYAAALLRNGPRPSVRAYLRNRFLRIFPAYWFAVLGAGLVLRTTNLPPLEVEGRSLASEPDVLAANLLLVQSYSPSTLGTGISPTWSLGVEVVFYLVLPALAALAVALAVRTGSGRRRPWLAALAPAAALLVLGQVGTRLAYALPGAGGSTWSGSWHAVVMRSFLAQASLFAAGLVLAVLYTQMTRGRVRLPAWWRPAAGVTAVVAIVPAMAALSGNRVTENRATLAFSAGCVLLLALVVLPGAGRPRWVTVLGSRPLTWSGLVSYGVFLWNEPVVWLLRRQGWTTGGRIGLLLALIATVVVTATVALLSWRLVERPALALKRSSPGLATEGGLGTAVEPPAETTESVEPPQVIGTDREQ